MYSTTFRYCFWFACCYFIHFSAFFHSYLYRYLMFLLLLLAVSFFLFLFFVNLEHFKKRKSCSFCCKQKKTNGPIKYLIFFYFMQKKIIIPSYFFGYSTVPILFNIPNYKIYSSFLFYFKVPTSLYRIYKL